MVTRTHRPDGAARTGARPSVPWRAGLRSALRAGLLTALLAVLVLAAGTRPARAQEGSLYFVTIKKGVTDASGSGESIFNDFAAAGDPLKSNRQVKTRSIELDVYGISRGNAGLGIGLEVVEYDQAFYLQSGERVNLDAKGVLFSLKTFLRMGPFFPFVGLGLGNYYVNYAQAAAAISFRDSPDSAYNARAGVRILLGRLGLLLEAGNTHARLPVQTSVGRSTLELGGYYRNVGISWVF
jgi:hypothetical protein